jgi:hypothetical protein
MRLQKLFVLFIALLSISCERDDICAETTATTPRLLIEFYDASSTEDLKSVLRLTTYGDSPDIPIPIDEDFSGAVLIDPFGTERMYNRTTNTLALPLKIEIEEDPDFTKARFILEKDTNLRLDDNTTTDSNIDILEITYKSKFVYVSRACGYKSVFTELNMSLEGGIDGEWISNIVIEETLDATIENENTVHVRIFH